MTNWVGRTSRILSHRIASRDPPRLMRLSANSQGSLVPQVPIPKGVRVRQRGKGQPMNDLIVRKSGLPPTKQY